ncbi:hypothetical protein K493DRAFT_352347 [Basidiobolus meristosporus CBS 931.73]|uniref:N-acetyltransferase domain-containing protein n=1 Tax=Basidiobolus meristosporus CBS 931.73 TaxID=1314790 RepID=A0A1Y1Y9D3_9FUNG|nr:hypothetical protein K493DRAFT_352347 [Basidiobolus meristosporus CBS 931.73]|eukprot:ORX94619.1 hypothetical protein K493DRAFT_352347 [Basidiobolus meristosporus CBS 931.73]
MVQIVEPTPFSPSKELRLVDVENELEYIHAWVERYSAQLPVLLGLVRRDIYKQWRPAYYTTFAAFDQLQEELGIIVRVGRQISLVVTSEITLRQAPRTEHGFSLPEHQRLFDHSVVLLRKVLGECLKLEVGEESLFAGLDCIWKPVLLEYATQVFDGSCFLYSLPWKEFLQKRGALNDDELQFDRAKYELDQVRTSDLDLVLEHSKIKYEREYLVKCLEFSRCLRSRETGSPVAWSLTHEDFSIASLHALPSTRRQGLASVVLTSWLSGMMKFYQLRFDPDVELDHRIFHSTIEVWNSISVNFFVKFGFKPLSTITWLMVKQ